MGLSSLKWEIEMGDSLFFRIFGAIALGQTIQEDHSDSLLRRGGGGLTLKFKSDT
jgi:hypothetical protein